MREPTVIELLKAIRDRNDRPTPPHKWNEEDYRDAVAALKIIEESKDATRHDGSKYKLVPND